MIRVNTLSKITGLGVFMIILYGGHVEGAESIAHEQMVEGDLYPLRDGAGVNTPDVAFDRALQAYAKAYAEALVVEVLTDAEVAKMKADTPSMKTMNHLENYAKETATTVEEAFFRGRFNRSRARLPENIDAWRSQPDIANPGADLANFPNSAFTLPQGRAYIEMSPLTYYGSAIGQGPQWNSEFLLRYGVTDNIEARIFGNGATWQGASYNVSGYSPSATGFSPIAFDTKIHFMEEMKDYYLPAIGLEAYIQTKLLGTAAFDQGLTPGITFNFDQSIPFDIDFEYNIGTAQQMDALGHKVWQFSYQWAFQRDLFNKYLAVFIHGFYNAMTLPRLPGLGVAYNQSGRTPIQDAIGAGLIWTPNNRVSFWVQCAGGATTYTPSVISNIGFAVAF